MERTENGCPASSGVAASPGTAPSLDAAFQALLDPLRDSLAALHEKVERLLDHKRPEASDEPCGRPADSRPAPRANDGEWQEILLGPELAADPSLAEDRAKLLADVLRGDSAARALAGQFLLVQTAAVDEMPEVLRHVGEAYYGWCPHASGEHRLEKAMANWLTRLAEVRGLQNSIQLVRLGERYDASRHIAEGHGVEVVAVHGWIVLRDNKKVYTKARVSVR